MAAARAPVRGRAATSSRGCSPTSASPRSCSPPTCWCAGRSTRCSRRADARAARARAGRRRGRCSPTGCSTPACCRRRRGAERGAGVVARARGRAAAPRRPVGRTCSTRPRSCSATSCACCATRPSAWRPGTSTSASPRARARCASPGSTRRTRRNSAAGCRRRCARTTPRACGRRLGGAARSDPAPLARARQRRAGRRALRDLRGRADGIDFGDLTSRDGAHRLLEWANGPASAGAAQGVTRYLEALHARRARPAASPSARSRTRTASASCTGRARPAAARGSPRCCSRTRARGVERRRRSRPRSASTSRGYLRTGIGVGEAARLYVAALEAAGVPVRTEVVDPGLPHAQAHALRRPPAGRRVPVQPRLRQRAELPGFARRLGAQFFEDASRSACGRGRRRPCPAGWDEAFALVDEIWTYSELRRRARSPPPRRCRSSRCRCRCSRRRPRRARCRSSSATPSRSCSRSTSSRPRGARTRSGWSRRSRARSRRATGRSS